MDRMKIKTIAHSIHVHQMNSVAIMDVVSLNHGLVIMKMTVSQRQAKVNIWIELSILLTLTIKNKYEVLIN